MDLVSHIWLNLENLTTFCTFNSSAMRFKPTWLKLDQKLLFFVFSSFQSILDLLLLSIKRFNRRASNYSWQALDTFCIVAHSFLLAHLKKNIFVVSQKRFFNKELYLFPKNRNLFKTSFSCHLKIPPLPLSLQKINFSAKPCRKEQRKTFHFCSLPHPCPISTPFFQISLSWFQTQS